MKHLLSILAIYSVIITLLLLRESRRKERLNEYIRYHIDTGAKPVDTFVHRSLLENFPTQIDKHIKTNRKHGRRK